ncbi:hypothetical protein ArsFIN_04210 [Arsenophonus nasoniae]|uniref:Transposase IS30-like HTH domain-containing protein n=1 Tax=Arsenophonus nasoniae TaxID=638 RepID=A0A4P7KPL0_9GAMM|nr:hypothetical protein ArsFIN_04210 [Arsenophonus nasoniae]
MLTKEIFVDIHVRFAQGQSLRKIASELGISRNTVKHHLQQQTMPTYAKRSQQPTKLSPLNLICFSELNWLNLIGSCNSLI